MRIFNRRARHDYQLFEKFEAGIALTGSEVKSIKGGRGDLSSSFVRIKDGEAWLVGTNIPRYAAGSKDYDPLRTRKLLLHRNELVSLDTKMAQQNLTLVPISLYTKGRLVKVRVALGKGKKQYEKRDAKRKKDIERDVERALKER
ncbi:MAG: SsrA-binding protein SmpB [bacterium]|nr:SsrA-binding protein SmpB [bacterium]